MSAGRRRRPSPIPRTPVLFLAGAVAAVAVSNIAWSAWLVVVLRTEAPSSSAVTLASLILLTNVGAGFAATIAWAWLW